MAPISLTYHIIRNYSSYSFPKRRKSFTWWETADIAIHEFQLVGGNLSTNFENHGKDGRGRVQYISSVGFSTEFGGIPMSSCSLSVAFVSTSSRSA